MEIVDFMGSNGRMGLLPGLNVVIYIIMLCNVILGYTMLSNVI